jgi:hypothetical protein
MYEDGIKAKWLNGAKAVFIMLPLRRCAFFRATCLRYPSKLFDKLKMTQELPWLKRSGSVNCNALINYRYKGHGPGILNPSFDPKPNCHF